MKFKKKELSAEQLEIVESCVLIPNQNILT